MYIYLQLICIVVWQKPVQNYKAILFQLKNFKNEIKILKSATLVTHHLWFENIWRRKGRWKCFNKIYNFPNKGNIFFRLTTKRNLLHVSHSGFTLTLGTWGSEGDFPANTTISITPSHRYPVEKNRCSAELLEFILTCKPKKKKKNIFQIKIKWKNWF